MQRGPHTSGNRAGVGIGVDQDASLRFVRGDLPVGVAQFLMKFYVFGFESVRRAATAAGGGALHPDLHRDVENNRQVGLEIADRDPLHRIENRRRDMAQPALIHPGRVRKPVAQHP